MMDIRPVNTDARYCWALKEIEPYFETVPKLDSPDGDRFDVLATLIEAYEARHHPIPPAAPIDVIRFVMEQRDLKQSDLAKLLGSRSRASEILSGSRTLTLDMIKRLNQFWNIPADLLIRQQPLKATKSTETVVAVFDIAAHAEVAINDLIAAGIPSDSIEHYAQTAESTDAIEKPEGLGFWAWLTNGDEVTQEHHALYDQSIKSGGTVVTVIANDADVEAVYEILEGHSPIDLDGRHSQYSAASSYGTAVAMSGTIVSSAQVTTANGTEEVIELSEETLAVGKRAVDRGTTRVRRYVVERPIEEQVRLRNESVSVFRRPVTGGATVGANAFTNLDVSMTETDEEAVAAKSAHVVEEVVVQKGVEERVETIKDTLRREEVEIEGPTQQPVTDSTKLGPMPKARMH